MKAAQETIQTPIMDQDIKSKFRWPQLNWRGAIDIVGFFVAWHFFVKLGVPEFKDIASPFDVLNTFLTRYINNSEYWSSWVSSSKRVLYGFLIAQLLGIPLGLLLGTREVFHNMVYPVIEILRPIPPLAWVPISILFWPTTESSIIFICFIGAFFIIVINVHDAVRSIKQEHIWLAQSLGTNKNQKKHHNKKPTENPTIAVG